jgi:hypothetical protein
MGADETSKGKVKRWTAVGAIGFLLGMLGVSWIWPRTQGGIALIMALGLAAAT